MDTRRLVRKALSFGALALFVSALVPASVPAQQRVGLKEASGPAQLIFVPPEERKEFTQKLKWELYDAYQVIVTGTGNDPLPPESDPATILVLKGSGLSVDFHGQKLGSGGLKPATGDVKSQTTDLLKKKGSKMFRVADGAGDKPDLAVAIVPRWIRLTMAAADGGVLSLHLSNPHGRQFIEYSVSPIQ